MNNNILDEMNIQERDILGYLMERSFTNQRELAQVMGYSIGIVNRSLKYLQQSGYLTEDMELTNKTHELSKKVKTRRAVILAAGAGMRMVPINTEVNKGLLQVQGEVLIERLIRQLQEVGITEIYLIVGFLKEQYEYLIDQFHVNLIVNREYALKNNLYSLVLAKKYLDHTYILPCDIWCRSNPFHKYEMRAWYMVSRKEDRNSNIYINRKYRLIKCKKDQIGNRMVGISYLMGEEAEYVKKQIENMVSSERYEKSFWEDALWAQEEFVTSARLISEKEVLEINTYEQLRQLDANSSSLDSKILHLLAQVLSVDVSEITEIMILKKGMTNRSFRFLCNGKRYIMRIPGEGTEQLINRQNEYEVYQKIQFEKVSDDIYYINPKNGYKLTGFLEDARVCDPWNRQDVKRCMDYLRQFHERGIQVEHCFDLFGHIEYYESLWNGEKSLYCDYEDTKKKVYALKQYVDTTEHDWTLTHIDAVPDNFLFLTNGEIRLIDWEYAGMQDPHVDIAMFAVYSMYDREEIENLIEDYFNSKVGKEIRLKIYCYIAICGLLWSNWCEYKRQKGVEFGEYSLRQYHYAKEYYRIFQEEKMGENCGMEAKDV